MGLKLSSIITSIIIAVFFMPFSGNAKPLTRGEVSKFVQEGEYASNGKRIQKKKTTRRPASKSVKKKKAGKISKHSSKRKPASKQRPKRTKTSLRSRPQGLPYAKETPNEKDMPFISVPTTRVRRKNKTIVMEDPGAKPAGLVPEIVPESAPGVAATQSEEVAREPASPAVAPVEAAPPVTEVREPVAFETQTGPDPNRQAE